MKGSTYLNLLLTSSSHCFFVKMTLSSIFSKKILLWSPKILKPLTKIIKTHRTFVFLGNYFPCKSCNQFKLSKNLSYLLFHIQSWKWPPWNELFINNSNKCLLNFFQIVKVNQIMSEWFLGPAASKENYLTSKKLVELKPYKALQRTPFLTPFF